MGLLITKDDFIGKYAVAKSIFDELDSFIERYEEDKLRDLLGVELFNDFKTAYEADPLLPGNPELKSILDPIKEDNLGGCPKQMKNQGMKQMVLGLVYFQYMQDIIIKQTQNGGSLDKSELSDRTDSNYIYDRYNEAVADYNVIQWFIEKNSDNYPKYNGIKLEISHWAL